ncbi:hypothetical protein [Paenibacillus massiliensis]|uniref:hypothetical protein n=1 Tax=Paenibacillus massiliensis TaxID=225917 RepID=UPI0004701028|nr:hypothetical protein [Paenibacillus massiliensis]
MREVIYNRQSLYQEIWAEPVDTVAKRYGVAGTTLRKYCSKLRVPVPTAGYWVKLKHGKKVTIPTLPHYEGVETLRIVYYDDIMQIKYDKSEFRVDEVIEKYCSGLVVPNELIKPHSIVKDLRSAFKRESHWGRGVLSTSDEQFPRVLLILDTVIKAVEKFGGKIEREFDKFLIKISFQKFNIKIREKTRRVKKEKVKEWGSNYDYIHTGELLIEIDYWKLHKKVWNDTSKKKIESDISEIIIAIFTTAKMLEEDARRKKIDQEKREEERLKALRHQKLKEDELEKVTELLTRAADYRKSLEIRELVQAIYDKINSTQNAHERESLEEYANWALEKADWLDPMVGKEDPLLGHKHHK